MNATILSGLFLFVCFVMQLFLVSFFLLFSQKIIKSSIADNTPHQNNIVPRRLLPKSNGMFDQTIERIIEVLDSGNISEHILTAIQNRTPPIDVTPGINSVTRLFDALPQDVKTAIISAFPDTINFPGTRLWEAVAQRWVQLQSKSSTVRDVLEKAGILNQARNAAKVRKRKYLITLLL